MTKSVITGGAGFIGSNLAELLESDGEEVVIVDNFKTGHRSFLNNFKGEVINLDLTINTKQLTKVLSGANTVYHLAANADVRDGWKHPTLDHEQNTLATLNVLNSSVEANCPEIVFSSTGSVYGEAKNFPTNEADEFPIQTSLYGASKVAAEGFIQAFAAGDRIKATIFRFVSVLGPRYTHGHVIDFLKQLTKNPNELLVLGDGKQKKSYMHVADCIKAVSSLRGSNNLEIFNLGHETYCEVNDSISWILRELDIKPKISFSGGSRGWVGDNPFIWLDVSKAKEKGWVAEKSIEESVIDTVRWLQTNSEFLS